MKQINVGIIGFGTVGSGTVEILFNNREKISNRVGADINVKRIADLDLKTDRGIPLEPGVLIKDAGKIINDPEIDIVVELIGGTEKAKEYILGAIKKGKHVVTANKALLAKHGSEIYQAAEENSASLAFEASVGGGIPVIRALREGLAANNIKTIMGILNGTSNYILTRMAQDGLPYDKAVQEAIALGYSEDPPDLDVDGTDAAHKLAILISVAFGAPVSFESIYREGIDRLTPEDIRFADEFGYCLKLLAVARDAGGMVEARVHPAMLSRDHILANVNDVYNAVYIEGDFVGPNLYYGLGAGRRPAGSAVVSDIIAMARQIRNNVKILTPPLGYARLKKGEISIQHMDRHNSEYYFRFSAIDKPGVLSRIAGILGDNRISISSVIQKERKIEGFVPIVMLTHEASESDVTNALKLIDRLDVLTARTMMIRVEG
ncbi:MAG TPA: homoserine dehydrogenase [Desulfatiglandales bacterium]|nr:homoserine dehydrogenase [Desulfatiglandales bacterium]